MNLISSELSTIAEITRLKLVEDRYLTLRRYLKMQMQKNAYISAEDIEMVMKSLDDEQIEKEKEING